MITCREIVDFLMAYLDGELDQDQRTRFDAHLALCAACVTYMKAYVETVRLGKVACSPLYDPVPEDVPDELVRAILAARGGGSS